MESIPCIYNLNVFFSHTPLKQMTFEQTVAKEGIAHEQNIVHLLHIYNSIKDSFHS